MILALSGEEVSINKKSITLRRIDVRIFTLAACLLLLALAASAGPISGTDPPANLVVVRAGYDWVWASPCAAEDPSCGTPLIGHDGYAIPTDAQWLASFTSYTDVYNAFNANGEKCASAYFNSGYDHCDPGDLQIGAIWHSPLADPEYWGNLASDSFLVRSEAIPEPSSFVLIGLGLATLIARRRRG